MIERKREKIRRQQNGDQRTNIPDDADGRPLRAAHIDILRARHECKKRRRHHACKRASIKEHDHMPLHQERGGSVRPFGLQHLWERG